MLAQFFQEKIKIEEQWREHNMTDGGCDYTKFTYTHSPSPIQLYLHKATKTANLGKTPILRETALKNMNKSSQILLHKIGRLKPIREKKRANKSTYIFILRGNEIIGK